MSTKLIVGPINKGYTTNRLAFNIDNDSFPKLINAYQWRGRVKRKRGTQFLNRLTRIFGLASIGVSSASPWTINTIYSTYTPPVTPEPNATIKPGSVVINITTNPIIRFVDQGNGSLSGFKIGVITNATQANPCEITSNGHTLSNGDVVTISGVVGMGELNGNTYTITVTSANTFTLDGVDATGFDPYISNGEWISPSATNFGTINYLTGVIVLTHTAGAGVATTASFQYFPTLPVMGLEDYIDRNEEFVQTIAFDTIYAYNLLTVVPYSTYSISYYKNPPTGLYPGYVQKTTWTPLTWNGQDYQQFWSTNYEGAFWATNGIEAPFDPSNVGMQFKPIITVSGITGGPPATATLQITAHGLVVGDFIFVNEVVTTTGINYQTGYVITVTDANNVIVEFPNATIATNGTGGIAQYLTSRSDVTRDCIRWYDGDPTNGSLVVPGFTAGRGWVNFMPPLSQNVFSIGDAPARIYYLVGAKSMIAFKDRLVFFSPVIQTSSAGSQIYLEDTILYSQNGTPFYTASYTNTPSATVDTPTSATNIFTPLLVPVNQIASPNSWFCDQTGFGGYIDSGLDESINTVGSNEDVLILGFDTNQVRMVYTGNDIVPFNLFVINSELGATSTFSTINMDQGVITRGNRGYTITNQTSSQRIDLDNPDQVFEIANTNNGTERFCSQRDFINEWIYFTYLANETNAIQSRFPTETFQYNHRDNTWAIFKETYTTYGAFRKKTGFIWATVGLTYPTWSDWNEPWDAGNSTLLQQTVIAGNQQGFVILRGVGTGEGKSLAIDNISGSIITSPDHCLNLNDFIIIEGVNGSAGQYLNGKTFSVSNPSLNSFTLNPTIPSGTTYTGGGTITRLFIPQIQTKQFPPGWELARKTRIGVQQYLLSKTPLGQITLYIYLSTDDSNPYNFGPIVPEIEPENNALVYSTVLNTCPESTNMGLTPANTNLQQLNLIGSNGQSSNNQQQIWHRINTSLLGDTIQLGFTISDAQMRSLLETGPSYSITDVTQDYPTVVETTGNFGAGSLVKIIGVEGMTELNFNPLRNNHYYVISSTTNETILDLDSTLYDAYTGGGTIVTVANFNATEEVELHGMILDITPSGLLS
jgi:hypothetical protein